MLRNAVYHYNETNTTKMNSFTGSKRIDQEKIQKMFKNTAEQLLLKPA